jgi:hypothetical protein
MIGTKKLSTIREEIRDALSADGQDPIKRLDQMIAASKRKGKRTDLTEGLKRFLQGPPKRKPRRKSTTAKK